jgi:hypothetical protein
MTEQNENKTSARILLEALLNKDMSAVKDAYKMMQKHDDAKSKTIKAQCKQYRHCTVITTCKHCGVSTERIVTLETKTESFNYIGSDGKVFIITYHTLDAPYTYHGITEYCGSCREYINNIDRDELEEMYMQLLIDRHEKHTNHKKNYAQALKKILDEAEEEV